MLQFGIKLKKPVQWVSVRNWDQMNSHKTIEKKSSYKKKQNI